MTTGSAARWSTAGQVNRGMMSDRMIPERTAPDAEQGALAGHGTRAGASHRLVVPGLLNPLPGLHLG